MKRKWRSTIFGYDILIDVFVKVPPKRGAESRLDFRGSPLRAAHCFVWS